MDPSTMWRLQEACQRNLVERQRIRKRLQHLTGKRSGELLCNDKNRHGQPDDWPCLTSFGTADARERMSAPAPQSGPKRARQRKLKHGCCVRDIRGELPPPELLVVGHQLPMHPLPMTAARSHHTSEHLQQQQQPQQPQQQQQQKQEEQQQPRTHTHALAHAHARSKSQSRNQQAASGGRAKAEPPYPNGFVYFLSRTCHPHQQCAQSQAEAQAHTRAQPQPQPPRQRQRLSEMHVRKHHLVLDARFMAELLDEILL
ncbi:mushroom body large-type Kenyon cell-specific protein 1 [Drosophila madeirensis]|uniref:Mushroom body large-type Kenyon cell-specific protein 1 n=1 Tax=Drosophila madeirensis TaxID=30013 RepID=A0AAU9G404_DROMD